MTLGSGGFTAVVNTIEEEDDGCKKMSFEEKLARLEEIVALLGKGRCRIGGILEPF